MIDAMKLKDSKNQPRAAVIVLCWNNVDLLKECFESLKSQTFEDVITIMVDNGSSDESVSFTRKNYPWVKVIETGENTGFAKGNNIGIAAALEERSIEYFALVNTDATLAPDWLERIISFADTKPRAAVLQGTTLDYYNHDVIDSTHIYIARNGQATQGNWRGYYSGERGPRKVFGTNAAACVITRTFIEAQPFDEVLDETLFIYLEDVDLITRATLMGWNNYLVPGARAYHMGSASSGKNPGFSLYMTFRNNGAVLLKNMPFKLLLRMAPGLIRGDIDTIRHLKRTGNGQAIKKVLRGRLNGLLLLPRFIAKRHRLKKYRVISNEYLWQLMKRGF